MERRIKILAICGSPHRGNTYEVLRLLQQSMPEVDLQILMLAEIHLLDCLGCYTCINTGEENCPLNDDRDKILAAMQNADATIFASPTYARTISALMKKFVERTSFISHRPQFYGKYAMTLTTYGGFGGDLTSTYLRENFSQGGFSFVSEAKLMVGRKTEEENEHNRQKALAAYTTLIRAIRNEAEIKPSLGQLVYFRIFKSISELNKTKGWADYRYYKDKKDFYYPLKIPFLKKKLVRWIAGREIKKIRSRR